MIDVADKQRQGLHPALKQIVDRETEEKRNYFFCAACSHVLGDQRDRFEVNSSFEHICTNPYGFSFHIGCFSAALGCAISGEPNAADTWFAGYTWRLATCSQCQQHTGWLFERATEQVDAFYGLILDRIQIE
ncbi:MAG: cereblon family protein [Pseudomonadales bacterium]|jgi:hypothetical protein|nr:cereblon family protein [Pseudomonadales bacterium]MDP6470212.1 cereblon family protein [Pseudomonadales bacterium]MDP6827118.1 cereblon family protein [Pseudomonadales bacterium]MDP6971556.1 cereblon family protein [Pseudomonadales bacterium]|tara:strand:+ start:3468 stop:3863 length:396 start_codon:yes stop_codon:yes gene_type:complete